MNANNRQVRFSLAEEQPRETRMKIGVTFDYSTLEDANERDEVNASRQAESKDGRKKRKEPEVDVGGEHRW